MNSTSQQPVVDLVILTRDESPLHPDVERGIACQLGVRLVVHRVIGRRFPQDENRWSTIVRARNEGKRCGNAPWLMFLDDDVVLDRHCVRLLLNGLCERPVFAALAADYLGESRGRVCSGHVAMGAVLFRRGALAEIEFRWSPGQCECLCCCQDLRRRKAGIGYLSQAVARHISIGQSKDHTLPEGPVGEAGGQHGSCTGDNNRTAYVLTAFDRRHRRKFQHRFLSSLRAAGNPEPVLAFAYGLYPSERRQLEQLPGVQLIPIASNGVAVPIRRLEDFQGPLARLPGNSVVAYWDAGDVIFQDRLADLWRLAGDNPDRLLVVAEPFGHPENDAVAKWTLSIRDPDARRRAFELLASRPFLNGGFAAGTVGSLLQYLKAAHRLRHSTAMRGSSDWGDQTAMNLYCHADSSRFLAVDDRWNFCLCGRRVSEFRLLHDGRFVRHDGRPISAVHGNGGTFAPFAVSAPAALARGSYTTKHLV